MPLDTEMLQLMHRQRDAQTAIGEWFNLRTCIRGLVK
jgi:hypothetical protein